jgi:IS30 family transposase
MKQRPRIYYSQAEIAQMWDRWQEGVSLNEIGRMFDRGHSSVQLILSETGGVRPPQRRRSRRALSVAEREEISRGIVAGRSLRSIASSLGQARSTMKRPGIEHIGASPVNWLRIRCWLAWSPRSCSCSKRHGRSPVG